MVNAIRYTVDPLRFFTQLRDRYGEMFSVAFPSFGRVVYLADPKLVKELFTGDPTQLHAGEANATILEPAVRPNSVLTLDEGAHMRQRKLLLAPFHGRAVEHYREVILASVRRDMETWPVGMPFALRDHTQRITLDVILRAVYGFVENDDLEEAHAVGDEFTRRSQVLVMPKQLWRSFGPRSPWARFLHAREELDRLVYEQIANRRAAGNIEDFDDVLSVLMRSRDEDGNAPTDAELRDELVTVTGAGHETTATALAWAIERLLRHPDKLERLRASLADGEDDYLDAVIKETLRVRPIIADVARKATVPVELGGYELPAGTLLLASIVALHFDPQLYEDPWAFKPERWLNGGAPDTYTWIPFGGGVRRCLGASFAHEEMRVVLREVVLRADLRAPDLADERVRMRNVTLAPGAGGRVVLEAPLRDAPAAADEPHAAPVA